MNDVFEIRTASPEETQALGRRLGALLPPGSVVALRGDLAAGKTCLVRGIAGRADRVAPVHSPTFTIVNEYPADADGPSIVHVDLYRLTSIDEMSDLGPEVLIDPGDASRIVVIEWAQRAEALLPAPRVDIALEHAGHDRRRIAIRDHGVLPDGWRDALAAE